MNKLIICPPNILTVSRSFHSIRRKPTDYYYPTLYNIVVYVSERLMVHANKCAHAYTHRYIRYYHSVKKIRFYYCEKNIALKGIVRTELKFLYSPVDPSTLVCTDDVRQQLKLL